MPDILQISRRGVLIMPLALAACKRSADPLELVGQTMGTTFRVVAIDPEGRVTKDDLERVITARLATVNRQMSNWDAGSEISRFNAAHSNAPQPVSSELATLMQTAQQINVASDGQFDVTLGPVIEAWGFGAAGAAHTAPTAAKLVSALDAAGQTSAIKVGNGTLQKARPDTQIYLSSIGKGHGVDEVAKGLKALGLKDFMVEIGGDLYVAGRNPQANPWTIGIETPDMGATGIETVATIADKGMATSGDYRNYFDADGQRYSHILDAKTGQPVRHATASVTVLADTAMEADAWATAMLALGSDRGLEIAAEQNLAVLFIDRDGDGFASRATAAFAAAQV